MKIIEVNNDRLVREFLNVNVIINKNNPAYIQPLDKDVNDVFDEKKNKFFRFGKAKRWILINEENIPIGRIAAFTNKKYTNKNDDVAVGGFGFFDCIHNFDAACLLFDTAKIWLQELGMEAMDGPINFGERDKWWGLVIEGNEIPPLYGMNFNSAYYINLFEQYGFHIFYNQICLSTNVGKRIQDKFYTRHSICADDNKFSAQPIDKNNLEKFAKDFTIVYNKAWAVHGGMKQMEERVAIKMFNSMKAVMDERVNWFAYYDNIPIGIWINLPDLNFWFKYLHGKFNVMNQLKFLWLKKTKRNKKLVGLVFGVVPEFQSKGIDAYLLVEGCKKIQNLKIINGEYILGKPLYDTIELQWVGDFNPRMLNVAENLGAQKSRKLATYRYLFDRDKVFIRHPLI